MQRSTDTLYQNCNIPFFPLTHKNRLNYFQHRQLQLARVQNLSREMRTVIATGYSDSGITGLRRSSDMRKIRIMLLRHKMRFETITLLAKSDETISLYAAGFERDLPLRDIQAIIDWYQHRVHSIRDTCSCLGWKRQNQLIKGAFDDAVRSLSHIGVAVA